MKRAIWELTRTRYSVVVLTNAVEHYALVGLPIVLITTKGFESTS